MHNNKSKDGLVRSCQFEELSQALTKLRDACVKLSLLMRDQMTEDDSPERDQVLADVAHYLSRFQKVE